MPGRSYIELVRRFSDINMLLKNPYYVLGLPLEVTPRQIRRRREDLDAANDLGEKVWQSAFPYLLEGSRVPSYDDVKDAFLQIEDAFACIVFSYYWFWMPHNDEDGQFKMAFDCFIKGDVHCAEEAWQKLGKTPDALKHGICLTPMMQDPGALEAYAKRCEQRNLKIRCARHNLAVLYRLRAMTIEKALLEDRGCDVSDLGAKLSMYWQQAHIYERYREKFDDSSFVRLTYLGEHKDVHNANWELFTTCFPSVKNPQVSEMDVSVLGKVICDLPLAWQCRYVIAYAKKDDYDAVKRHVGVFRESFWGHSLTENLLDSLFGEMEAYHEALIKKLDQHVLANPREGLKAAESLFDATSKDYDAIHGLFDRATLKKNLQRAKGDLSRCLANQCADKKEIDQCKEQIEREEMLLRLIERVYDPVVKACFNYLFKYSEATKDWGVAIRWDEFLGEIVVSDKLRTAIYNDLKSIFMVQTNYLIEKFSKMVKDDSKKGVWAIGQLMTEVRKLLATVEAKYGEYCDLGSEIRESVATASRAFLVSYGNATKDWKSCLALVATIKELASDSETIKRLDSDFMAISENARQAAFRLLCWHCHCKNEKSAILFKMYGDIVYLSPERRQWKIINVAVPLCRKCKAIYYGWCALMCMVMGLIFATPYIGVHSWEAVSVPFGFGLLVGMCCYRFIRNHWFNEYPDIKNLLDRGYKYGDRPSEVQN